MSSKHNSVALLLASTSLIFSTCNVLNRDPSLKEVGPPPKALPMRQFKVDLDEEAATLLQKKDGRARSDLMLHYAQHGFGTVAFIFASSPPISDMDEKPFAHRLAQWYCPANDAAISDVSQVNRLTE